MRLRSTQLYIKEGPLEDSVLVSSGFTYESIYYGHYDDNETDMYLMLMLTVLASKTVEVLNKLLLNSMSWNMIFTLLYQLTLPLMAHQLLRAEY